MKTKRLHNTKIENRHINALRKVLTHGNLHVYGDGSLSEAEFIDYGTDRSGFQKSPYALLIFPASTEETAAVLRCCLQQKLAVVPSGGRTGLCGGAAAGPNEIVLSLKKMNRLLAFDPYLPALRVQAGMITAEVKKLAQERGFFFPIDLASSGSSQIGGNLATNAGGTRFIRYGGLRNWLLGLTVIAGNGNILRFPGRILKDNAGFDLKQLFLGQEGALGIITEAVLRLAPAPLEIQTGLAALPDLSSCVELLKKIQKTNHRLSAFEYWDDKAMENVCEHLNLKNPFTKKYNAYCLLEWEKDADETILHCLPQILLAGSTEQSRTFWKYREAISESLAAQKLIHKQDIAVPIARLPRFSAWLKSMLRIHFPHLKVIFFGHIGDGNLHLNFIPAGAGVEPLAFKEMCLKVDKKIYKTVIQLNGSISAEHGIGLLKKDFLSYGRSSAEIELMLSLKKILDPQGILNPGKVI